MNELRDAEILSPAPTEGEMKAEKMWGDQEEGTHNQGKEKKNSHGSAPTPSNLSSVGQRGVPLCSSPFPFPSLQAALAPRVQLQGDREAETQVKGLRCQHLQTFTRNPFSSQERPMARKSTRSVNPVMGARRHEHCP